MNDELNINNQIDRISEVIINRNEGEFKNKIRHFIESFNNELRDNIRELFGIEFLSHSLHYKSPSFGKWFRLPIILDAGVSFFERDKQIYETYNTEYLNIPEFLNVSLENGKKSIFDKDIMMKIYNCDDKIKYLENENVIVCPINKMLVINDWLKNHSIDEIIDMGRILKKYEIEKINNSDYEVSGEDADKKIEIYKLCNESFESIDELDMLRLLISGYIVFRNIDEIRKNLINKKEALIIYILSLSGHISISKKQGSWLLFFTLRQEEIEKIEIKNFEKIRDILIDKWSYIRGIDLDSLQKINHRFWSLEIERLIRELIIIDKSIIDYENKTLIYLKEDIIENASELCKERYFKIIEKIKGQNNSYIDFLKIFKETCKKGRNKSISIFLYSEPGTGKETLANLANFWGRFSYEIWDNHITEINERRNKLSRKFYEEFDESEYSKNDLYTINCSLLNPKNFSELLFGYIDYPIGLLTAAKYGGTCFFDEYNTIDKKVENNLLRLMVDPYEALVFKDKTKNETSLVQGINLLYIFASNKSPAQLIADGHNPAVISRISQYCFEITPLRERKEDLLLFFISLLNDENRFKKIERNALEFICMLKWYGNFRSIKGFVNDLINDRNMRKINNDTITFREVVECAVRRKLIGE